MARHLPPHLTELAAELGQTLTKEQACEVMHMSHRTFVRAVRRGDLAVIKSGDGKSARVIVTRAEIIRWMVEHTVTM